MTHRTIITDIFSILFLMISFAATANNHAAEIAIETNNDVKSLMSSTHATGDSKTSAAADHSNAPHSKATPPHMEELPHIHKFHKNRVKKIKKHHTKFWFASQLIIVLCHISILVIAYLHATH